ncbi:MAG: MarR family transcriptional regulator [Gammaproteobacteria bacterium]|nr:MarR family transcriptional regulator [Gammaproteobacteria bacterium]
MATSTDRQSAELAELVVQLGRAAYTEAAGEFTAAQWAALRYFSRANRFSRTVSGFAEYHATTRGTASQTIRSLVERGFLIRHRSERDGRSVVLDLSPSAQRLLRRDPLNAVARAAARLSPARREQLSADLRRLQVWLVEERAVGHAGICARCGYLVEEGGDFSCGLMREALTAAETTELCLRYKPV